MSSLPHRRHDISDNIWDQIRDLLPGSSGHVGRPCADNRLFINAVFWILRTGAPWRDLPPDYGNWNSVYMRFKRWRDKGVWERLLNSVIDKPDYEWLMIDASCCKVHPHAAGAKGGLIPKYIWPWMRLVCQSESLLLRAQPMMLHNLNLLLKT